MRDVEEELGYRLPGAYRTFLKAAGGCAPGASRSTPTSACCSTSRSSPCATRPAVNDLVYVNKCLRDHLTKDYLAIGYVQGGVLAVKVKGERTGSVWFCAYDDARDGDRWESPGGPRRRTAAALRRHAGRIPAAAGRQSAGAGDGGEPDGGRRLRHRRPGGGVRPEMVTFAQAQERAERWINARRAGLRVPRDPGPRVRPRLRGLVRGRARAARSPTTAWSGWSSPGTAARPPCGRRCRSAS